jgi:hypothetical protein
MLRKIGYLRLEQIAPGASYFICCDHSYSIKKELFMFSITANKLKRNGVAGIERVMQDNNETSILVYVRGKAKYVIFSVDEFNQYREYQLGLAIAEAEACLANGDCSIIEDFENYAQVLEKEISNGI